MKVISVILFMCVLWFVRCTPKKPTNIDKTQTVTSQNQDPKSSDTLGSVIKIIDNKSKYINKELAVLLDDLPVSVKSYRIINHNRVEMAGIRLSFYNYETTLHMEGNDRVIVKPIYLYITFKTPVPIEKYNELWGKSTVRGKWNTDDQAYYSIQIVGDLEYSASGRE